MRSLLFPLVPAIMRHLGAYAEVAGADARDAGLLIARRALALLLAAVAAVIALVMLCVFVMALTWDGPWRAWAAAGLAVLFAAGAAGIAMPLLRRKSGPAPAIFPRVREEWRRDRDMIERALEAKSREAAAADATGAPGAGNGSSTQGRAHVGE